MSIKAHQVGILGKLMAPIFKQLKKNCKTQGGK